jgi:purine-nucleoside phosphorylase
VTRAQQVEEGIAFLRERLTRVPRALLVFGSGLSAVGDEIADRVVIPYSEIPGFPRSTVAGHPGVLVAGIWQGVEVAAMLGRFHLYEGWEPWEIGIPLRIFRGLGADHLVVTNAAGGLRPRMRPGDLMLIADHINLMFRNPLIGPEPVRGERFPDMSDPYDVGIRQEVMRAADELEIYLHQGVYAGVLGPSYETPAELQFLRVIGADAVGMSTVPEVIVARALEMKVLGISCITNVPGAGGKVTHEEVLAVAGQASERLLRLLRAVLPRTVPPNLATEAAS